MKRLVALILAVAVCLSVVSVAMADDGQEYECMHGYNITETTRYRIESDFQHVKITTTKNECMYCDDIWYYEEEKVENHSSKDNKTYNYHLVDKHFFYQLCVCGKKLNETSAPCPGGDNHIGIILGLPPVVLETK